MNASRTADASVATAAPVTSRAELLTLLSEACELEHGLLCSYLYTALSLKQNLAEGGLTWQQLALVKRWASQIYFVASQEMLHLALAWNLISAIGGAPYYFRPNFPQRSGYYPIHLPLKLERFGVPAIQRFVFYERPTRISPERSCAQELGVTQATPAFRSVGQLYQLILSGFLSMPENDLFIGAPRRQVGPELADFPNIIRVTNRASAQAAIEEITRQGEGRVDDRHDSHFGIFSTILTELKQEISASPGHSFEPARPALENPAASAYPDSGAPDAQPITDPSASRVAALFDDLYVLMLRMLAYVFNGAPHESPVTASFAKIAIVVMPTVLKPLGEALMSLPAGREYAGACAGPGFGLSRHTSLQEDPTAAERVVAERFWELLKTADELASQPATASLLSPVARTLRRAAPARPSPHVESR